MQNRAGLAASQGHSIAPRRNIKIRSVPTSRMGLDSEKMIPDSEKYVSCQSSLTGPRLSVRSRSTLFRSVRQIGLRKLAAMFPRHGGKSSFSTSKILESGVRCSAGRLPRRRWPKDCPDLHQAIPSRWPLHGREHTEFHQPVSSRWLCHGRALFHRPIFSGGRSMPGRDTVPPADFLPVATTRRGRVRDQDVQCGGCQVQPDWVGDHQPGIHRLPWPAAGTYWPFAQT
jgi:hypothetical protein